MELKHVKQGLASQKAMFLLMLKAVRNGKITDEFLDATEAALRMAGDQVSLSNSSTFNFLLQLEVFALVRNCYLELYLSRLLNILICFEIDLKLCSLLLLCL